MTRSARWSAVSEGQAATEARPPAMIEMVAITTLAAALVAVVCSMAGASFGAEGANIDGSKR